MAAILPSCPPSFVGPYMRRLTPVGSSTEPRRLPLRTVLGELKVFDPIRSALDNGKERIEVNRFNSLLEVAGRGCYTRLCERDALVVRQMLRQTAEIREERVAVDDVLADVHAAGPQDREQL